MRIERIYDVQKLFPIIPIELKLHEKRKITTKARDLLSFIQPQLNNPLFGIWVVYDDADTIAGYCVALINPIRLMDLHALHIWRIWYDQHKREAMDLIVKTLAEWAEENRIKTVRMEIRRGTRALQKKWKFRPVSIVMERRL